MSVSVAINNALTGLNINQQALTVLSQNIANANTQGYSRQIINQKSVSIDGVGEGVSIDSITRKIDDYLTRAAQTQTSDVGLTSTVNDYYAKIQLLLGTPGNQNSVDSYVNGFFNALQSLTTSPDNTTLQQTAVNSGVGLANQLNQLANGLNALQFQADQDINSGLNQVNGDLANISKLNKTIAQSKTLGRSTADLEDQRDGLIKDVSQFVNVSTFQKKDGSIFLTTAGGISMIDDNVYKFSYTPTSSANLFANNGNLNSLTLAPVDSAGNPIGSNATLTTGGTATSITTLFTSGKIAALTQMRDTMIPNILSQIDSIASTLRDQVNGVHNQGTGYPGANSLTGTRGVFASDINQWGGSVRIAALDSNGQPVASPYADETYGAQPMNLNLSTLDTGNGPGNLSVQGIVNAINQKFGVPQNKAEVGNLNNIQVAVDSQSLPNANGTLAFDFNLNNISATSSNFFLSNVTVKDDQGVTMNTSATIPSITLNSTNTYITQLNSTAVIVNTAGNNYNLQDGDMVYLSTPPVGPDAGGTYDNIQPSQLGGYFKVSNVSNGSFQINVTTFGVPNGSSYSVAGQTALPKYATAPAGGDTRARSNGIVTADVSTNTTSSFYTVSATVGVDDGTGNIVSSVVNYRVFNNQPNAFGSLAGATSASVPGRVIAPVTQQAVAIAKLVDANGQELPKINGQYVTNQKGFLQITAGTSTSYISIDSLDSLEQGKLNTGFLQPGTKRGFSYYFEMNNFFNSNKPTTTGDTVANSASTLSVESRIKSNNSLMSLGKLSQGGVVVGATLPNYTYQLNPGDNTSITQLASLASQALIFPAAGGLGATTQTLSSYSAQILGSIATNASNSNTNNDNSQALLNSYTQKTSAVSGVNLDTELANTVIYQNAYAASARVITVTNQLFDTLLQSFSG